MMKVRDRDQLLSEVGQRIREHRIRQGLRLKHLALLSGINSPALSMIETGKRDVRLTSLARIAAAMRVPLFSLLEDEQEVDERISPT